MSALLTPVSQNSQNKTRTNVAQSSEDGEEALTCVKRKRKCSKGILKRSGIKILTSNDRVV